MGRAIRRRSDRMWAKHLAEKMSSGCLMRSGKAARHSRLLTVLLLCPGTITKPWNINHLDLVSIRDSHLVKRAKGPFGRASTADGSFGGSCQAKLLMTATFLGVKLLLLS